MLPTTALVAATLLLGAAPAALAIGPNHGNLGPNPAIHNRDFHPKPPQHSNNQGILAPAAEPTDGLDGAEEIDVEEVLASLLRRSKEVEEEEDEEDCEEEVGALDQLTLAAAAVQTYRLRNPKWKGAATASTTTKTRSSRPTMAATATSSNETTKKATTTTKTRKTTKSTTTTKPTTTTEKATTTTTTTTKSTVLTLPTPPSSSCFTQYTDTSSGAVYGPGLGDFPMSPRPSTFVKRSGSKLTLDGETFRMVGPNIYWLGLDENVNPNPSYPDKGRVREAMAISVAMGANVIRSHTLGVSTGTALSLWPSANNVNNDAFDAIDYAIFAARNYGLRLVIPLTDNYAYYHGGKFDFIGWAGFSRNEGYRFYWEGSVIALFKTYIATLLNHKNAYTGVRLKDDPTILAWETGNELGGYMLKDGAPPASWSEDIASYIKGLAPNHLVFDGADGLTTTAGYTANTGFDASSIDAVTDHFYPAANWLLRKDDGIMKSKTTKNFFVGELDWTGQKGGDSPSSFYSILESMEGSGSMIWSVFGHDAKCCNWVPHNDGYTLHYPNGNTGNLGAVLGVVQHWYRMRGLTPPKTMPAVACPQPELEY